MNYENKVVLITGANRGLGLEIAKAFDKDKFTIVASCRQNIIDGFNSEIIDLQTPNSISNGVGKIIKKYKRIDILINNAAVYIDDPRKKHTTILELKPEELKETIDVNYIGHYHLISEVIKHQVKNSYGRIINISSGMGRLSEFDEYSYAYRASKLLINTMTISFGKLFDSILDDISITSVCPGWVKTEMGGNNAQIEASFAAKYIADLASRSKEEINGKFMRYDTELNWEYKKY